MNKAILLNIDYLARSRKKLDYWSKKKVIIRQVIVIICKIIRIVIFYFTQLLKKTKNFFLL